MCKSNGPSPLVCWVERGLSGSSEDTEVVLGRSKVKVCTGSNLLFNMHVDIIETRCVFIGPSYCLHRFARCNFCLQDKLLKGQGTPKNRGVGDGLSEEGKVLTGPGKFRLNEIKVEPCELKSLSCYKNSEGNPSSYRTLLLSTEPNRPTFRTKTVRTK